MKYIDENDLASVIQERFLDESTANIAGNNDILDDIESKAIDYSISYISTRYNTDLIFSDTTPLRNGVLRQIIAQIVVFRSVRRNPARKVPDDYMNMFNEATRQLERIQSGAMKLVGMPLITDESGNNTPLMWGNTTNSNYFI
ncbi:MAG: phage protein Gp36 family protein [Paludibacter sp.]|nr:phage protein Gp36 family protein [Paludibacter sp.]